MKKTNIVKLASVLIDDDSVKSVRCVINDNEIEFFTNKGKTPVATAKIQEGQVIIDNDDNQLTNGEYTIGPLKVIRVGDVPVDSAKTAEKAASKSQDKTTRSASPVTRFHDSGM